MTDKAPQYHHPMIDQRRLRDVTPAWWRWYDELCDLERSRTEAKLTPHSLGIKWEDGMVGHYNRRIAVHLTREPKRYRTDP